MIISKPLILNFILHNNEFIKDEDKIENKGS